MKLGGHPSQVKLTSQLFADIYALHKYLQRVENPMCNKKRTKQSRATQIQESPMTKKNVKKWLNQKKPEK